MINYTDQRNKTRKYLAPYWRDFYPNCRLESNFEVNSLFLNILESKTTNVFTFNSSESESLLTLNYAPVQ